MPTARSLAFLSCNTDYDAGIKQQVEHVNKVQEHTIWSNDEVFGNGLQQYLNTEGRCEKVIGHNDLQAIMLLRGTDQQNRNQ